MNATILFVDDDYDICQGTKQLLVHEGFNVLVASDGIQALELISNNDIHLIIMDIMMPRMDGLSATMKIRENKNIPIILLSAKSEESDKVIGLGMGADDYITKPYQPSELIARVKSHIRRYLHLGTKPIIQENIIQCGDITLNQQTKEVFLNDETVKLTAKEFGILELLMLNAGIVFSAEQIYEKVWNEDAYGVENTVMVHIRHIRQKIEINPKEPKYLKVVWGIGYKMEKNN